MNCKPYPPTRAPRRICAASIAAFLTASALASGATYQVALGDLLTVSTAVPDSVIKEGRGTLVLTGTQSYAGPTTVNEGVLVISSIGNLGNTSAISIKHNPAAGTSNNTGTTPGASAGQLLLAGTYAPQTFDFAPFGGLSLSGGVLVRL